MSSWHNKSTDELCEALTLLKTKEEFYAFLDDVCSIKEFLDIAQRLSVAKLIKDGVSYNNITKQTGASAATISRVRKCLDYGSGGYNLVFDRKEKN